MEYSATIKLCLERACNKMVNIFEIIVKKNVGLKILSYIMTRTIHDK